MRDERPGSPRREPEGDVRRRPAPHAYCLARDDETFRKAGPAVARRAARPNSLNRLVTEAGSNAAPERITGASGGSLESDDPPRGGTRHDGRARHPLPDVTGAAARHPQLPRPVAMQGQGGGRCQNGGPPHGLGRAWWRAVSTERFRSTMMPCASAAAPGARSPGPSRGCPRGGRPAGRTSVRPPSRSRTRTASPRCARPARGTAVGGEASYTSADGPRSVPPGGCPLRNPSG